MKTGTKDQKIGRLLRDLSLEFYGHDSMEDEWLDNASNYAYRARERLGYAYEDQIRALIRKHVEPLVNELMAIAAGLAPAPTPAVAPVAPKADYTLDDVKSLINNLIAANPSNKDAIKATIAAYAPTLAQCSQMQLNAVADELEKLQ